jgi:hypothetical protein
MYELVAHMDWIDWVLYAAAVFMLLVLVAAAWHTR